MASLLERFSLVDDGTMDTVIRNNRTGQEFRFDSEFAADYRNVYTGELNEERFLTMLLVNGDLNEMDYDGDAEEVMPMV